MRNSEFRVLSYEWVMQQFLSELKIQNLNLNSQRIG
jgi:hypothetical protein